MTKIKNFPISALELDPENPRLPETLQGGHPSEILKYLYDYGSLDELAQSFLDNGFFPHEPILVVKERGQYLVVEGNRRLATLLILHGSPEAEGLSFPGITPTRKQLTLLQEVPAFELDAREDAHLFLGFRHIGGIKTWDADAKARYLQAEVERSVQMKEADPFKEVGRRVGSNAQGVRNSFIAIKTLQTAREQFGINTAWVMQERFGVWLRCMNSPDIKQYIGLDSPRTYPEITVQLHNLNGKKLREVVGDLTPPEGRTKAILSDSRQVTDYGRVLSHPTARDALRRFGDLRVAAQMVEFAALPARLARIVDSCKVLYEQLPFADEAADLHELVEQLVAIASSIRDVVGSRGAKK